jgi:hypothetical protein
MLRGSVEGLEDEVIVDKVKCISIGCEENERMVLSIRGRDGVIRMYVDDDYWIWVEVEKINE